MAVKSKVSRLFVGLLDPALDNTPFPVDQFQFDQAQQIAGMIDAVAGAFASDLVILAQDGRQLQLLEVVAEQHLRRSARRSRRHRIHGLPAHAALPGMRMA